MKIMYCLFGLMLLINAALVAIIYKHHLVEDSQEIPNMMGVWKGTNLTVSELKGYKEWGEKVIHITEQKDRRFRGTFTYSDGTKNFFGVIYPDNISFTWVANNSRGYNHGRILDKDQISACYFESWEQATAGCATLDRQE